MRANSFKKRMDARAKQYNNGSMNAMHDVIRNVGKELVLATPVKTGRMRSNWVAGTSKSRNAINPYFNFKDYGSERAESTGPNYSGAVNQHNIALSFYTKISIPFVIANVTSYLSTVNYGTARQTPILFFERALGRTVFNFNKYKLFSVSIKRAKAS